MKRISLIFALLLGLVITGSAQKRWNLGAGYFGQQITYPGAVLQLEYEAFTNKTLSLPLRFEAGFYNHNNSYNVVTLDIHRGFRKYVSDQLFLEQGFGAGVMLSFYRENFWHEHEDQTLTFFTSTPVIDFMPSTTLGLGYNLSKDNSSSRLLWCRSKISWQLFNRELSRPYFGLMIGYTHSFKS
jgi:hypothetical protein